MRFLWGRKGALASALININKKFKLIFSTSEDLKTIFRKKIIVYFYIKIICIYLIYQEIKRKIQVICTIRISKA